MFTFFNVANRKILNYVNDLHYMSIGQWWFRESGKGALRKWTWRWKEQRKGIPISKNTAHLENWRRPLDVTGRKKAWGGWHVRKCADPGEDHPGPWRPHKSFLLYILRTIWGNHCLVLSIDQICILEKAWESAFLPSSQVMPMGMALVLEHTVRCQGLSDRLPQEGLGFCGWLLTLFKGSSTMRF